MANFLKLSYNESCRNHLDTFHGSIVYTVAEISAGFFLARNFPREQVTTIPVLRRSQVKYAASSHGELHSTVTLPHATIDEIVEDLYVDGKILIVMRTLIHDETGKLVFKGDFEWFVSVKPEYLKVSKSLASIEK